MIEEMAKAMARVEGFGAKPDNRPTRNNNPGNLEYHDWMVHKYKLKGTDGRFAIFVTPEDGWKAMIDILSGPGYRNLTLKQVITRWNGTNERNNQHYINLVCQFTGFKPDDVPSTKLNNLEIARNKSLTHDLGVVP